MNCPQCNTPLTMSERQGVEIDYCPQCRGVWLDRGELDKILERHASFVQPPPPPPPPPGDPNRRYRDDYDDDDDDDRRYRYGQGGPGPAPRQKRSWLSELFD